MIVYDVATKLLGTELLSPYNVANLVSGSTLIVFFSQHRSLYDERKNTHTHAHTHTHTHTHTHRISTFS